MALTASVGATNSECDAVHHILLPGVVQIERCKRAEGVAKQSNRHFRTPYLIRTQSGKDGNHLPHPHLLPSFKLASTIMSGCMLLPFSCTVAFTAIAFAMSIQVAQRYVSQNHLGWFFTLLGVPLLLVLNVDFKPAIWILVQLPIALGSSASC